MVHTYNSGEHFGLDMAVCGKKASEETTTLSQGCAEDFEVYCQPCDRDDVRQPAFGYCVDCKEHLCQACFITHRKPKPSQHHQLLDKEHMPMKQNLQIASKSTPTKQADSLTMPCSKHTKEVIKLYCHDHDALLCSVCVALQHTPPSCHVDYIPDISQQTLDSNEFNKTLKDLDQMTEKCCKVTKDQKQRVAESITSLEDVITHIDNFREEINKRLNELEKEAKDTATTIQHDNNKKLTTTETTCENIVKSLQVSANSLKHLNTNKKADQLFTELKIAQQLIKDSKQRTSQLSAAEDIDEYVFEPNQAILTLLQNEKSFGTLKHKNPKQSAEPTNQSEGAIKFSGSVFVRGDLRTGLAASPPNRLFAAIHEKQYIEMIDIEIGQVIQELSLKSQPWDLTVINKDTIAVTIPDSKKIQYISFSSNTLSLKNKLKVGGKCHGISHHQGKLAVTFLHPGKLHIMDLKGNVLEKVGKDSNGDDILWEPKYVDTNSQSIYVSDSKKSILWFNWQGEMIGRYESRDCRSIALLEDGSFLVGDHWGKFIYRVSDDCKTEKKYEIQFPYEVIYWCPETSTLYTSMHEDWGCIYSYDLKLI
ncbi:E3 ubiquitin-protein ligase TRIM71-like [Ruditapes philippinarum]|uniref:E3 ubiquitin-protein ligase TRIM71-like n=1 Tax=Ruditapes philippinarum TaxID=129788 RepID=UPI00295AD407|nr:E3 ubiquitin-protein ligase TRIM71-like [Ruditapes philippinarum]